MANKPPAPIYRGQGNSLFRTDAGSSVIKRGQDVPYNVNGAPTGAAVAAGDKGDITVGDEWTIDPDVLSAFARTFTGLSSAEAVRQLLQVRRISPFRVAKDKTIRTPGGARFIVRGVHMFPSLFVSQEYRLNYLYRVTEGTASGTMTLADGTTVATGAASGISAPTYTARERWISEDNVNGQINDAADSGVNLIIINIEPAIRYSPAYTDPNDGLVYPSELDMADGIIETAHARGMVVLVRSSNDQLSVDDCADFNAWMADRWKNNPLIWINPRNEINCFGVRQPDGSLVANANCTLPSAWVSDQETYVSAIRGAGFRNPVVLNPTSWGGDPSAIESVLDASSVLSTDPNLVIGVHIYKRDADTSFLDRRSETESEWRLRKYCTLVEEFGTNNGLLADTDTDGPPTDATEWADQQTFDKDFLRWAANASANEYLQGLAAFNWGFYRASTGHDPNSLRLIGTTNDWSTWGGIFRDEYLQRRLNRLTVAQCRLEMHSSSVLKLLPYAGDQIPIGHSMSQIPYSSTLAAQGVAYTASGLSSSTLYYVYACLVDSAMTLLVSTTGYLIDPYRNLPVKTDNRDATLVGIVRTDASGNFVNSGRQRFVRSYWNRKGFVMSGQFAADRTRAAADGDGEINAEVECEFLTWADEVIDARLITSFSNTTASAVTTKIMLDGASLKSTTKTPTAGVQDVFSMTKGKEGPSEGYHIATLNGSTSGGTATWKNGGELSIRLS